MEEKMYKEKYLKYKIKYLELKETLEKSNVNGGNVAFMAANRSNQQRKKREEFDSLPEEEKQKILEEKRRNDEIKAEKYDKEDIEYINDNIRILEEKYINFKKNTCGFIGCRAYANFIKSINNIEEYHNNIRGKYYSDKLKKSNEYKKLNEYLKKYKNEVLSKQKECQCITFF